MELGGSGRAQEAARMQDKGDFLGFHVISHGRGGDPDSGQETKGLWAGRTPGRRDCTVQEVAALLFMSPIASENILYHVHSWLSTNSKAIFIIV